ncbi:hypothetical protein PIB30_029819 [Stylosanthes scabra]|uniref:Uncharacterized protein n=1 Tax=Stylosanthes scabra TaxID=79078 RepID=A0ABU6VB63_9FABA|nr:hypothetical protein [Stylosanthes scabra]
MVVAAMLERERERDVVRFCTASELCCRCRAHRRLIPSSSPLGPSAATTVPLFAGNGTNVAGVYRIATTCQNTFLFHRASLSCCHRYLGL